jgi:hypothetical protein
MFAFKSDDEIGVVLVLLFIFACGWGAHACYGGPL